MLRRINLHVDPEASGNTAEKRISVYLLDKLCISCMLLNCLLLSKTDRIFADKAGYWR